MCFNNNINVYHKTKQIHYDKLAQKYRFMLSSAKNHFNGIGWVNKYHGKYRTKSHYCSFIVKLWSRATFHNIFRNLEILLHLLLRFEIKSPKHWNSFLSHCIWHDGNVHLTFDGLRSGHRVFERLKNSSEWSMKSCLQIW